HAAGHVEQRVEWRVREELAEHLEAALASPHAGEPVVDERHARRPGAAGALPYCARDRMRRRQYSRSSPRVCSSGMRVRQATARSAFSALPRSTGTSEGRSRSGSVRTSIPDTLDSERRKLSTRSMDQSTPEQRL